MFQNGSEECASARVVEFSQQGTGQCAMEEDMLNGYGEAIKCSKMGPSPNIVETIKCSKMGPPAKRVQCAMYG